MTIIPARPPVVVFAGTRDLNADALVAALVASLAPDTIVLHGDYGKIDHAAERHARARGLVTGAFKPNWLVHGKPGGPKRTWAMFQLAPDTLYLIWDGKSPGSKRARDGARKACCRIEEHIVNRDDK